MPTVTKEESLRALLVEDAAKDAELIVHELKGAGYQVSFERVDTPDSFAARIAEGGWDVVLCDNTMPCFSGSEAFELFKRSGRDIPFIYVSGTLTHDMAIDALKAGAQDYIAKSNLKGLVTAVEREINKARARRETRGELQRILEELCRTNEELLASRQAVETERQRLTALLDITEAVTSTLDLGNVVKLLLEKIDLLLPYALTTVCVLNQETGELEAFAARNIDEEEWKQRNQHARRKRPRAVLERKAPVILRDIKSEPALGLAFSQREGLVSYLGLPLVACGTALGVIGFYTRAEHEFSAREVQFLSTLAGQIAVAIYQARLHEQIRRQASAVERANQELSVEARQQAAVAAFGHRAIAERDLDTLMGEAVTLVAQTLEVEYCKILQFLSDGQAFLLRAGVGWKEGYVGRATVDAGFDSQAGYTLLSDKPVIVEDLRTETRFCGPPLLHDHGVVSGMSIIIRSADRPFGILGAHTTQRRSFTRHDINFFESIANILAAAIKRAQAEEVSSRLAAIVESTEDAIIGRDTDGVVTSWNKGAEKIFGYTAGEMLGRSFFILIPPSESERVRRNDERIKRGEWVSHYETVRVAKGGKLVDVSIAVSPVRDASGKIIGASTIARDIRERKWMEREILEISSKERQRLGQDLHDGLGQQLTGIALMSKALEERLKGKSSAEVERVTRIIGHVNDAINLTRAMAKGLVPVEIGGQGLISALSELAAASEKLFGITCVSRCDPSVIVHDKLVATHLYRIVQEAIDNSVKHGNAQHVSIQLNRFDGRGALSVTDDGSGFFLDDNRTHGIGLRTMGYRAETIGGSFEIKRGQDGGTVVTCTFPLRESISC